MAEPRRRAGVRQRRDEQMELFPEPVHVEQLDAGTGPRTSPRARYRVTVRGEIHVVHHDRHGVYCEEHGRACRAVAAVAQRQQP